MKALVYTANRKLEWLDWPDPQPEAGEALVRVEACGVCGSDVHGWQGKSRGRVPPLVLGHEMAGRVAGTAAGQSPAATPGARVAVYPVIGCGNCRYCLAGREALCRRRRLLGLHVAGGLAEYLKAPVQNLFLLPESVSVTGGALVEPLANALHFVRSACATPGPALIMGAGAIGLLMLIAARRERLPAKAEPAFPRLAVAEVNPHRAAMARALGADLVVDPRSPGAVEELQQFFGEDGCRVAFDAAGFTASRHLALKVVASGGMAVLAGMGDEETPFDCVEVIRREIRLTGVYGYSRAEFQQAIDWLAAGKVPYQDWVTEASLQNGQRIFEQLTAPGCQLIKAVFKT